MLGTDIYVNRLQSLIPLIQQLMAENSTSQDKDEKELLLHKLQLHALTFCFWYSNPDDHSQYSHSPLVKSFSYYREFVGSSFFYHLSLAILHHYNLLEDQTEFLPLLLAPHIVLEEKMKAAGTKHRVLPVARCDR